ncbi:MAG TPA: hypothetical protein PLF91_10670 [Mycolicibacterium fallax]|nr:hypothetical protein [Mycolicibacterium fallax]
MSLNPRAIATLGVGFGATAIAYLGLWPVGTPAEPPTPPVNLGGFGTAVVTAPRFIVPRDDRDLLELLPILIEVLNRGH